MAQLPPLKTFLADDYAGVTTIPAFASKLFYPLNLFLNSTYSGLNNGLTINQNMLGMVTTSTSITPNSSGVATTTINWKYPQSPPVGLSVQACTNSSQPAMYPLITWSYNAGVITISMQFIKVSSGALVTASGGTYSVGFWVSGG